MKNRQADLYERLEHLPAKTRQSLRGALPQAAAAYWDSLD
jgi:CRISPR/Cas system-associated endonuclease Cas1